MLALLLNAAQAQEAPGPSGEPFTDPFPDVLAQAKDAYFGGRVADAVVLFEVLGRRLSFGERPGSELESEALIYLGEVYQSQGRFDDAALAFRTLVESFPDAVINPYHHPPEVVAQFNGVRELVLIEIASRLEPPPPLQPAPWWTLLPFGVGHLGQGKLGAGVVYGASEVTLGVVSIAMDLSLRRLNGTLKEPHLWDPADFREQVRRIQLQRFGVQWPATFGFYGVWAISVADARIRWREDQLPAKPVVTVSPLPGGADLRVSFRW